LTRWLKNAASQLIIHIDCEVFFMKNFSNLKKFYDELSTLIYSTDFIQRNKAEKSCFTRNRKISFQDIIFFILSLPQLSLPNALAEFFPNKLNPILPAFTKQAFSKARNKVLSSAFRELFYKSTEVKKFYKTYPTWNRFHILAIDGTFLQVPDTLRCRKHFGVSRNQFRSMPQPKVSALYDISRDLIIDVQIDKKSTSEKNQCEQLMKRFYEDDLNHEKHNSIILFDRGYPGREMFHFISQYNGFFVMRTTTIGNGVIKEITSCEMGDHIINYKWEKKVCHLRVLKFQINENTIETLVTNVFDSKISLEEFKKLYSMRWGIETKYRELKSYLLLENFCGITPNAVEQEIYATLFMANMGSVLKTYADIEIKKERQKKWEYCANRKQLLGNLAKNMKMLLQKTRKKSGILKNLLEAAIKNRSQKRPDRHCERKLTLNRRKFHVTRKRTI